MAVVKRSLFGFLVLSLLALGPLSAVGVGASQGAFPGGIYWLGPQKKSAPAKILENPIIRGIVLRMSWQDIEPSEGRYSWAYFDKEVERASKWGKVVSLRVVSGGRNTPTWALETKGLETVKIVDRNPYHRTTHGKTIRIPVFWDPVLLDKQKRLLRAFGQRFGTNPHIATVNSPCANGMTGDWNVPASSPQEVGAWRSVGYAPDKLIRACQELLRVTMDAFPSKVVVLGIGGTRLDRPPALVAQALAEHGYATYPNRFMVMRANLSARTPDPRRSKRLPRLWKTIFDHRPAVGAQMLWFVTDDPTFRMNGKIPGDTTEIFRRSLQVTAQYGLSFIEIYHQDLINEKLSTVLKQFSSVDRYRQPLRVQ